MNFISINFGIFFTIVAVSFFVSQKFFFQVKNNVISQIILLASSVFFYALADLRFLPVLFYVSIMTYVSGLLSKKKIVSIICVIMSLLPLLIFKYTDFIISPFTSHRFNLFLPLGISFFTFQSISYIVDCHKGRIEAEKKSGYSFSLRNFLSCNFKRTYSTA